MNRHFQIIWPVAIKCWWPSLYTTMDVGISDLAILRQLHICRLAEL
jgi:hypothetical protein